MSDLLEEELLRMLSNANTKVPDKWYTPPRAEALPEKVITAWDFSDGSGVRAFVRPDGSFAVIDYIKFYDSPGWSRRFILRAVKTCTLWRRDIKWSVYRFVLWPWWVVTFQELMEYGDG